MSLTDLVELCIYAAIFCGVLMVTLLLAKTKRRSRKKDKFRSRKVVGKENLGKTSSDIPYRELAKIRGLSENKLIRRKPSVEVTKHITATAVLFSEQVHEEGEES